MRNLFFIALSLVFVNGGFDTSVFLENIKSIKTIYISYEDAHGNKQRMPINMNNKMISDELIIISEEKRQTSLREVKLSIPDKINSIEVDYIDKNNKDMNIFMGIALDDRSIIGDNLYIYKDKDFNHKKKKNDFGSLFQKASKSQETYKKPMRRASAKRKTTKSSASLDIKHFENENYIEIEISNCGNKTFDICDEVKEPSITGNSKKVIFYFNIEKKHTRIMNPSDNIKRIEVGYNIKRDPPTHLVIEVYKSIDRAEKIYNKNGDTSSSPSTDFTTNHKKMSYRLHIR